MSDAGCQSRFNGGMHFYDSVPAGIELCLGIGDHAINGTFSLIRSESESENESESESESEIGLFS